MDLWSYLFVYNKWTCGHIYLFTVNLNKVDKAKFAVKTVTIYIMVCCASCSADNQDALWLPKNSIRAIIAIIITIVTFGALTFLIVDLSLQGQYTEAVAIAGI